MRHVLLGLGTGACALTMVVGCGPAASDDAGIGTDAPAAMLDAPGLDAPGLDAPGLDAYRDDAGPPPPASLVDEAVSTCVWTSACLTSGAAPNSNVGSCIATFMNEHEGGGPGSGLRNPWDDYRACVAAAPTSCEEFRGCLLAREAICDAPVASGDPPEWQKTFHCADGSRACSDPTCLATCSTSGTTCSSDGSSLVECMSVEQTFPCGRAGAPGSCVEFGGTAQCIGGEVGTCTTPGASCEGDVVVLCQSGIEVRLDCASLGQSCNPTRGCEDGTECTYMDDACMGDVLRTCVSGHVRDVDCAALGGTCGTTRISREACRFPEGMPTDAGLDAGVAIDAFVPGVDAFTPTDAFSGPDAFVATDAFSGPDAAVAACNALSFGMPEVVETAMSGTPPTMTGGTLPSGTWNLTGWYDFGGAAGSTRHRETFAFGGGAGDVQSVYQDTGLGAPYRTGGMLTFAGTSMTFAMTCPSVTSYPFTYTVTAMGELQLRDGSVVRTYARECDTVGLLGAAVPQTMVAGSITAYTGGTIADGTYVLTRLEIYSPGVADPLRTASRTITITGGSFATRGTFTVYSGSGTLTTAGTTVTFAYACPFTASFPVPYTASGSTLILAGGGTSRTVYTRM